MGSIVRKSLAESDVLTGICSAGRALSVALELRNHLFFPRNLILVLVPASFQLPPPFFLRPPSQPTTTDMFSTFLTVALFVAPAIQGVLADFAISSPALTQCKQANISWEPTEGPYNLIVVKASDPCGDALVEVGDFSQTHITWTAKLAAGQKVQLSLVDKNDQEAWSNVITVGDSNDASCLSSTGGSSASASASASAASASSSAAALTGPGSSTPPSSGTPGSTPGSGADTTDGDDPNPVPVGAANAGILGNAAFSVRQASTPLLVLSGLAAAFALSL
ncbi:hypothetical protein D9619_004823 [Psilocybe cf. subviscida]|uniref:Uncharacterized protein n=1 Tax=Psilocybe cf. subviscida TaxID=2480587 RepID=A0A8H5F8L6_9AGAR|nr:hypothetical protein D9619_004823 [Psilocybe cf. subviscida]